MAGAKGKGKSAKGAKETPLMAQYNKVKAQHPDALLLFRVGDFYETFGQDAVTAAKVLREDLDIHDDAPEPMEMMTSS